MYFHYQLQKPQGELVMALQGEIVDVVLDIRQGSPYFGKWVKHLLSSDNHHQLYVPPGFAHGFVVLSDTAIVQYKVSDYYNPGDEYGIIWNDPGLAIDWPVSRGLLSDKDRKFPNLIDDPDQLPKSQISNLPYGPALFQKRTENIRRTVSCSGR
jgi:dTDP-4-dehydrorhamnose 3,5-epimerase